MRNLLRYYESLSRRERDDALVVVVAVGCGVVLSWFSLIGLLP